MNINDRVYIITTESDDYFSVTVTPATVRRIITTQDLDADGSTIETIEYMVAFDGENPSRNYHRVTEDQVVSTRHSYNHAQKIGDAVMGKIEEMKPAPPAEVGPPPSPGPAIDSDTPF